MTVFCSQVGYFTGGADGEGLEDEPAEQCQNGVPDSGAEGCVEEELSHRHSGESGGNTDELADGRNETAEEGGGGAVVAEIGFGVLNLRAVNQADVTETTVCETIDQGATEPTRKPIVDECAEVCSGGGNQHHKQDVQCAVGGHGKKRCRRNHHLRGERNERTFHCHEYKNPPVVEVGEYEVD